MTSDAPAFEAFPADRKDSGLFYENLEGIYRESGPPEVIVVGLGPGSYAGVRIAIATAIGLKAAANARLVGLPSICAIDQSEYLFVGDARRNSFFFAHVVRGCCRGGTEARVRGGDSRETAGVPAVAGDRHPAAAAISRMSSSSIRRRFVWRNSRPRQTV